MKFKVFNKTTEKEIYFELYEITNKNGICLGITDEKGLPINNLLEITPKGLQLYSGITTSGLPLDNKGCIKVLSIDTIKLPILNND